MTSVNKTKTKKKIPKSINDMSKEMLQETLKKKRECNAKALDVVEKLCEMNVDEEWFLENLQHINQSHYDDATVERSIIKQCGYPLCNQKLEKILAQQYHISTKYNKVFDISERKNFCSSSCYKASVYVKNQLFTSPLWFRDQEVIPKYKLLKNTKSKLEGEVVNFTKKDYRNGEEKLVEKITKLSVNDKIKEEKIEIKERVIKEGNESMERCDKKVTESIDVTVKEKEIKTENKAFEIPKEIDIKKVKKSSKELPKLTPVDLITKVEQCIFEWYTLDTLFYLYNERKIKELYSEEASRLKEVLNSKLKMASHNDKIDKMIQFYGLFESESFSKSADDQASLKPLPDYSTLKEKGKNLEIKVKAFYQGQLEINPSAKMEKDTEKKEESKNGKEDRNVYLPLIDAHAQMALRKKIVLDKLNTVLPDMIRIFSTDYALQMSDFRDLVSTFSLTATNITFRPNEWYLVAIILLKMLSLKDESLNSVLQSESSKNQLTLLLMGYEVDKNYLDNLIERLTNSENIMEKLSDLKR